MGDAWNFQGWVALPLERYARNYLGKNSVSADDIALGKFVDTMLKILSAAAVDPDKIQKFEADCNGYAGLGYTQIPDEIAEALFNQFKGLMDL